MTPISKSPATISLTSGQDITKLHQIKRVEVNNSYRTIGSYQSPTGSMEKEIQIKEKMILTGEHLCKQVEFIQT